MNQLFSTGLIIWVGVEPWDDTRAGAQSPNEHDVGLQLVVQGGILAREGTLERPALTEIFVVNDYAMSWLAAMAVLATLKRRAQEGGSYRIHLSLTRLSMWLLQMGLFDKDYAHEIGTTTGDHAYLPPEVFQADTPCGTYQGVTDQVLMTATPGHAP